MDRVVVIIPTIKGREESLARTVRAYEETSPDAELIIIHDKPTCGVAWQEGSEQAGKFDYIHFTADDLVPHPGWLEAAKEIVAMGGVPAPIQLTADGQVVGSTGETGSQASMTVIPFCSYDQWQKIGPMVPWHYYTDNYFTDKAKQNGWESLYHTEYKFTHYFAQEGRGAGMTEPDRMHHDYNLYRGI